MERQKVTLIKVPGVCHGPEEYARSPIHDRFVDILLKTKVDCQVSFIPSAEVEFNGSPSRSLWEHGKFGRETNVSAKNRLELSAQAAKGGLPT